MTVTTAVDRRVGGPAVERSEARLPSETTPQLQPQVLVLDEEPDTTPSLDALAVAVAVFGRGGLGLLYAVDQDALHEMADALAAAGTPSVIVVDVDRHPEPKQVLAEMAEAGFPLAVVTDGGHEAIHDHALSVGAAAYLPTTLPAREMVSLLTALARPTEIATG